MSIQGSAVTVKISSTHFTAIPAASATTPHKVGEGHYHLFLDVLPTAPGEVIPKTTGIFHTADSVFTIPNVPNGHHKLYVVLGYSDHTPYQHVDVVSARPQGAIVLLEFDATNAGKYTPGSDTIKVGNTVKWTITDNQNAPHTVTADDGSFDSGSKNTGETFSFTFTKAGTFAYHCTFHANMTGKITVT